MKPESIKLKVLSVFFLLFIFQNLSAQNKDEIPVSETSIGFIFSPSYSNAVQQSGQTYKFAYTTGFNINHKVNNILSLSLGLLFTDLGYKDHLYKTNEFIVFDTLQRKYINKIDPNSPSNIKFIYNYHYLEIPVNIQYNLYKQNKLSCFVSGGISLNYLIYSTTISDNYYDNGNSFHSRGIDDLSGIGFGERFELGGNIGFGLNYMLKNNFYLCIEPVYNYYILPFSNIVSTSMVNTLGIKFGIFYKLGSGYKPLPN